MGINVIAISHENLRAESVCSKKRMKTIKTKFRKYDMKRMMPIKSIFLFHWWIIRMNALRDKGLVFQRYALLHKTEKLAVRAYDKVIKKLYPQDVACLRQPPGYLQVLS